MLKISEVSKKIDLPIATIRYYTDLGLVPSVIRDDEGQRIFDDEAIVWLQGIQFQRELGTPIPEIKEYIELSQKTGPIALQKRHDLLLKQYIRAQEQKSASQIRLDKLNKKIQLENDIISGKKRDSLSAARRFN
ncbi:MerR family transcriptional regulator [Companilactobacillus halodurans]|uniref:MerR family transcriptional regulator n=1 Tax=Companilactobacillus halodurans TaxID=2584183 RepID=A0A5P0ZME0_9LACO|nr:MerR family transcriptional regulator [Companilactobacillus halodurans]MQS75279.1 MerR family transcriptional regulator [Companilactobacillus halodurans]MQS97629.1 MerR family transcriptional regulator [Companilactobacillus halodurans]